MEQHMEHPDRPETFTQTFSLLGGPLHRLGCRLGLVRGEANTLPLGLALGAFLWLVLLALSLIEGIGEKVFSMPVIGAHVRLLLAIPLLFFCESYVDPRMTVFVSEIVAAEVVPKAALPVLASDVARTTRWKNAWLPDVVCLLAAMLVTLLMPHWGLSGVSGTYDPNHPAAVTLTGQWYWFVCLTVFRFLLLRWLWRLLLWCQFLWRISRLKLHLIPTHPDGAAGLGYLEVVHTEFLPLILAISAIQSASIAERIATGTATIEAVYPVVAFVLAINALLFLAPLCIFTPFLWAARVKGLADCMALASHYVNDFDKKWLRAVAPAEPLLGNADLQSLADLSNSVNIVRQMHLVPTGQRLLVMMAVASVLPLLPLLLFQYPLANLTTTLFKMLLGL